MVERLYIVTASLGSDLLLSSYVPLPELLFGGQNFYLIVMESGRPQVLEEPFGGAQGGLGGAKELMVGLPSLPSGEPLRQE
jgi:hypothetical protein